MLLQRARWWSVDKSAPPGYRAAPLILVCLPTQIPLGCSLGELFQPRQDCTGHQHGSATFPHPQAVYAWEEQLISWKLQQNMTEGAKSPAKTKSNAYFEFLICLFALCTPKEVWPTPKECIFMPLINHSKTKNILVRL